MTESSIIWRGDVLVDGTGRIIGRVRRTFEGEYAASTISRSLGTYISRADAQRAVEKAVHV